MFVSQTCRVVAGTSYVRSQFAECAVEKLSADSFLLERAALFGQTQASPPTGGAPARPAQPGAWGPQTDSCPATDSADCPW